MTENTVQIPDFLIELSRRLNTQPTRCTSHPFYQVRFKREYVTAEGYEDIGFQVYDEEEGAVYDSRDSATIHSFSCYLAENYREWMIEHFGMSNNVSDKKLMDFTKEFFNFSCDNLPDDLEKVYIREIEEVVSTHLTLEAAEAFIKRKQHDHPKLYTYAESAYWSPELRQLQDWIKSLTAHEGLKNA